MSFNELLPDGLQQRSGGWGRQVGSLTGCRASLLLHKRMQINVEPVIDSHRTRAASCRGDIQCSRRQVGVAVDPPCYLRPRAVTPVLIGGEREATGCAVHQLTSACRTKEQPSGRRGSAASDRLLPRRAGQRVTAALPPSCEGTAASLEAPGEPSRTESSRAEPRRGGGLGSSSEHGRVSRGPGSPSLGRVLSARRGESPRSKSRESRPCQIELHRTLTHKFGLTRTAGSFRAAASGSLERHAGRWAPGILFFPLTLSGCQPCDLNKWQNRWLPCGDGV